MDAFVSPRKILGLMLCLSLGLATPVPTRAGRRELRTDLRPATAARVLTEGDHGRKFWFHPRQLFWVTLQERPEREGLWTLDPLTTDSVTLVRSERRYQENWKYRWSRPGHPGSRTWVFQANRPGITRLVFHRRPTNPRRHGDTVDLGIVVMGADGQGPGRGLFGGGHPFPREASTRKLVQDAEVARLFADIHFAYDKALLDGAAKKRLADMAAWLKKNASALVTIEGHCDERGTATYNYMLGKRRALATSHFLSRLGIGGSRLTAVSYGKMRPLATGKSEADHRKNRRVHFLVFE